MALPRHYPSIAATSHRPEDPNWPLYIALCRCGWQSTDEKDWPYQPTAPGLYREQDEAWTAARQHYSEV